LEASSAVAHWWLIASIRKGKSNGPQPGRANSKPAPILERTPTMQYYTADINSELYRVITSINEFDGTCDPAFDNQYEELERQFAELRISQVRELN